MRYGLSVVLLLLGTLYADAATLTVCASGCTYTNAQLQAAIDAAAPGDEIHVQSGFTYVDTYELPEKTCAAQNDTCYITLRTGVTSTGAAVPASSFPAADVRITPAYASVLAKFQTDVNNQPPINTVKPSGCGSPPCVASYWKLQWLQFIPDDYKGGPFIQFGNNDNSGAVPSGDTQDRKADEPHHFIVDQVLMTGDPVNGNWRGMHIHARDVTVKNSYIKDIKSLSDTQGIWSDNSTGNITLTNNYIEGNGENVLFGGSNPRMVFNATVLASPAPTTTTATLSANLPDWAFVGQGMSIVVAGQTKYTHIVDFTGAAVTFETLPSAPSTGAAVNMSVVPRGITITKNHLFKPPEWRDPILTPPTGVSASGSTTGGACAANTYYYVITARMPAPNTNTATSAKSSEVNAVVTSGTTGRINLSWDPVTNAESYRVYRGVVSGAQTVFYTTTNTTFTDTCGSSTGGTPASTGSKWTVKNVLELKHAAEVLIEGNLLEYSWLSGQTGYLVLFTVLNNSVGVNGNDSAVLRDIVFRNNHIRHGTAAMQISSRAADSDVSDRTRNVSILNNLWEDISNSWGSSTNVIIFTAGTNSSYYDGTSTSMGSQNLTIAHNTIINSGTASAYLFNTYLGGIQFEQEGLIIRDNIIRKGNYGLRSNSPGLSTEGLTSWNLGTDATSVWSKNVVQGATCSAYPGAPSSVYCPDEATFQAQFENYGTGDFRLKTTSAWHNDATDGTDIGANIPAIEAFTDIALSGDNSGGGGAFQITTTTLPDGTVGTPYDQVIEATGTPPYAWSIQSGALPTGLTLGPATGQISGTPSANGTFNFTVRATDDVAPPPAFDATSTAGNTSGTITWSHTTSGVNRYLLVSVATASVAVSSVTHCGDAMTLIDVETVPAGPIRGEVWGRMAPDLGVCNIVVTLASAVAARAGAVSFTGVNQTTPYALTIASGDSNLVTNTVSSATNELVVDMVAVRTALTTISAGTGQTQHYNQYAVASTIPIGASSREPGAASVVMSWSVDDGQPKKWTSHGFAMKPIPDGATDDQALSIEIQPVGGLPVITTTTLPDGTVGVAYSETLTATDGTTPYTWSVVSGTVPDGTTLSSGGVLSGTPTIATTYNFTVRVTDDNSFTDDQALSVIIGPAVAITTTTLPDGTVGVAYSQTLEATGGTAPYTWAVFSGSLPDGLTLSTAGVLSGTPTTVEVETFTVRVTDDVSSTDDQILALTIIAAPVVLNITTTSLPNGIVGEVYNQTMSAVGGTAPYVWSISAGALPASLTLSSGGVITGTPTIEETAEFTVRVTDSVSATDDQVLTISSISTGASTSVMADRLILRSGRCTMRSGFGSPSSLSGCDLYINSTTGQVYTTALSAVSDLTVNPTGDIVMGPAGGEVIPSQDFRIDLGRTTRKFRSLHAWELQVDTLVAQNKIATIGGRILVGPTTTLVADLTSSSTTIHVRHNNLSNGDILYMAADGVVEFLQVQSGVLGQDEFGYTYTVSRNMDGSGANQWSTGDAVFNTGTTGNGFIDLYSVRGVKASSEIGPTIVGNVRTGTTFDAWAPRWAIGNLNGLYGYATDTYGTAFGVPTAAWIKIDPTNGVRIGHNTTTNIQLTAVGDASFTGSITSSSGTIGGWTIAPGLITATGIQLISGAPNTARLNLTNNAAGVNAPLVGSDITFWAGDTHTNRAIAPFRVTLDGALTASSATITGNITATSGNVIAALAAGSITSSHIAANTIVAGDIAAGTITTTEIAANTIVAGDIAAGTITADRLSISSLSAISADLGSVTAGQIVVGGGNKLWLNDGNDGQLAIGGSTKNSAPFRVEADGRLIASDFVVTSGGVATFTGDVFFDNLGVGTRFLCIDATHVVYSSTTACVTPPAPAPEAAALSPDIRKRLEWLEAQIIYLTDLLERNR